MIRSFTLLFQWWSRNISSNDTCFFMLGEYCRLTSGSKTKINVISIGVQTWLSDCGWFASWKNQIGFRIQGFELQKLCSRKYDLGWMVRRCFLPISRILVFVLCVNSMIRILFRHGNSCTKFQHICNLRILFGGMIFCLPNVEWHNLHYCGIRCVSIHSWSWMACGSTYYWYVFVCEFFYLVNRFHIQSAL